MKQNLKLFSNVEKSFIFCDFDWQKPILADNKRQVDLYYQQKCEIHVWECGFNSGATLIELYIEYGENFAEKTKFQDSSFVLYDAKKEIIVAARDFMGNYPLFYYDNYSPTLEALVFSFSMNALLQSKIFNIELNYFKISEYITCDLYIQPNNHTFYRHIYRLLPANFIVIKHGKIKTIKRYATFDLEAYKSFTDEEFIDSFRTCFIESVKKHTIAYQKVGATLSGGLDSSSICSVAQSFTNKPIATFNFTTGTAEAEENEYIESVVKKWNMVHQTVKPTHSYYNAIVKMTALNAQPCFVINSTIQLDLIEAAKKENCSVFLSGHWGDQVVSYGLDYLEELVNEQKWKELVVTITQYFTYSPKLTLLDEEKTKRLYAIRLLLGKLKRERKWADLPKYMWILYSYFHCRIVDFKFIWRMRLNRRNVKNDAGELLKAKVTLKENCIKDDSGVNYLNISETIIGSPDFSQKKHLNTIFKANQIYGQEEYFEIYRQNSLVSAQPFFDASLVELSLNVPLRLKFSEGKQRGILRRAMEDFLPDKNRNRTTKGIFTNYYMGLFKELWVDFSDRTPDNHSIWDIVDKKVFDEYVKLIIENKEHSVMPSALRVIYTAIWLDYFKQKQTDFFSQKSQNLSGLM